MDPAGNNAQAGAALARRATMAKVLFVLGCAAAAIALFGMGLDPNHSIRFLGPCSPTDEEVANLRTAAERVLLAAAAQVLASTMAVMEPVRPLAVFACLSSSFTASRVITFFPMLVACRDSLQGTLLASYVFFAITLIAGLAVAVSVSMEEDD